MNKYILQKLATENKLSVKHVEEIIDGFYRGLRYYIERPEETKGGILITNYFKFHIDLHREMRDIEKSLTNRREPKRMNVFLNLIKYNKKKLSKRDYERQIKIQTNYEQFVTKESNELTTSQDGK